MSIWRVVSIAVLLPVQGCFLFGATSNVRSQGPFPHDSDVLAAREGVRYYVARDVIAIEARVIKSSTRQWVLNPRVTSLESLKKLELCDTSPVESRWDSTLFTVVPIVVPDLQEGAYRLGMRVNSRANQNLNIEVGQTGILRNVSIDVQDQRADVIANAVQGIAGVAGTLVGALAPVKLPVGGGELRHFNFLGGPALTKKDTVEIPLTDENCFIYSGQNSKGLVLRMQIDNLQSRINQAESDRLDLQTTAMAVTNSQRARVFRQALVVADARVGTLKDRLAGPTAALVAGSAAYRGSKGVGRKADTTLMRSTFDLAELQDIESTSEGEITPPSLDALKNARRFLANSARLVVVVEDLTRPTTQEVATGSPSALGCKALSDDDCVQVSFRKPRSRLVRVFARRRPAKAADERKQSFTEVSRVIVPLASSSDPILVQSFQAKAFAKSKMALTFGDHGDIVGVTQVGEAGLAAASGRIVEGLSKARSEFTSALATVGTAQSSIYGIQRAQVQRQLQQLQDEKSLVDAQIALQGANATADLQARSALLDAQIKAITSEQNLASSVAAQTRQPLQLSLQDLQAQLALANAQASLQQQPLQSQLTLLGQQQALLAGQNASVLAQQLADIQASIAQLKAQIDLVNQQMALEKARQDLGRLRQGSDLAP